MFRRLWCALFHANDKIWHQGFPHSWDFYCCECGLEGTVWDAGHD